MGCRLREDAPPGRVVAGRPNRYRAAGHCQASRLPGTAPPATGRGAIPAPEARRQASHAAWGTGYWANAAERIEVRCVAKAIHLQLPEESRTLSAAPDIAVVVAAPPAAPGTPCVADPVS